MQMKIDEDDSEFLIKIKNEFQTQMDFYFEKYDITTNEHLMACTVVDPRYKKLNFLDLDNPEDKILHKDFIRAAKKLIEKDTSLISPAAKKMHSEKPKLVLSDSDGETTNKTLAQEMKEYMSFGRENVYEFYKKFSEKFFRISNLANSILFSPATSVPTERVFSHASFQVYLVGSNLESIE